MITGSYPSINYTSGFQMTPSLPKSPIAISGIKVKKLTQDELGRSSRISMKAPAHWGT